MPLQSLPVEVRFMIWGLLFAEDEQEVCIAWPTHTDGDQEPLEPYLVDVPFPLLMHICRETRRFALSPPTQYAHLAPRFRFSKEADCKVPYRHFRPDLDIMYFTDGQYDTAFRMYDFNHDIIRQSANLAVDMGVWGVGSYWFVDFIFKHMQSIKTVSVIFPSSDNERYNFDRDVAQPPTRRCRLVKIKHPREMMGTGGMPSDTPGRLQPTDVSVQDWMDLHWLSNTARADLGWSIEDGQVMYNDVVYHGDAWDSQSQSVVGVTHAPCVFAQFKRSDKGEETWEEVCRDRLHPKDYRPRRVDISRDPTEWRVNDDEEWPPPES